MACRFGLGSVTYAQMAQNLLSRHGLHAKLVKLNANESAKGCAYGIETDCNNKKLTVRILSNAAISFRKL